MSSISEGNIQHWKLFRSFYLTKHMHVNVDELQQFTEVNVTAEQH